MRTIIALAIVLVANAAKAALVSAAKAATVSLLCVPLARGPQLGLIIDLANNTVMIDDHIYKIINLSPTTLTATLGDVNLSLEETLTLNRISGLLSWKDTYKNCKTCGNVQLLSCKPSQRMF